MSANGIGPSFEQHNHAICNQHFTNKMEKYCVENSLKLTHLRRKVFELLISHYKPLGAYQILENLKKEGVASSPPIACRVLDFLVNNGFVHKIKGLSCFIAYFFAGCKNFPAFIICRKCDNVAEIKSENAFPREYDTALDFRIENAMIEILGTCSACDM